MENRMIKFPLELVIIDDDSDIAEIFKYSLEEIEDIKIFTFTDPLKGVDHICKNRSALALIDLDMPNLMGDDLIRKVKDNCNFPVDFIVCSGIKSLTTAIRCYNLGAHTLYIKPPAMPDLISTVEYLVKRHLKWKKAFDDFKF